VARVDGGIEAIDSTLVVRELGRTQTDTTTTFSNSGKLELVIVDHPERDTASGRSLVRPESLYAVREGTVEVTPFHEIGLLKVRRACSEALERLDRAVEEPDVLARETIMSLFNDAVFRLGHYIGFDRNFGRCVALIHTVAIQNLSSVYSESQILGLRRCLKLVRDNIYMSDHVLRECMSILSRDAGFDLSAPTTAAEYYDDCLEP
jgi:hypothetical protein